MAGTLLNIHDKFLEIYATQMNLQVTDFKWWGERNQKQYIFLSALYREGSLPQDYKINRTFLYANEITADTSFLDVLSTYALEFSSLLTELPAIIKISQQCKNL